MPASSDDRIAALLTESIAVQREILTELRQQRIASGRRVVDDNVVIALLREIVLALGDHTFCTVDLLLRVPSPADERLRASIVSACGSLSPRRIGQLLRKHEGRDLAGMRICRTDRVEREGTVWQVLHV